MMQMHSLLQLGGRGASASNWVVAVMGGSKSVEAWGRYRGWRPGMKRYGMRLREVAVADRPGGVGD